MGRHDPDQTNSSAPRAAGRGRRRGLPWKSGGLLVLGLSLMAVAGSFALPDHEGISRAVARAGHHGPHPGRVGVGVPGGPALSNRPPAPWVRAQFARAAAADRTALMKLAQVRVTLAARSPEVRLPKSYLGVSIEYWGLPRYERHPNTFARALSLLRVAGDGPMILRIGGDSADRTYWSPRAPWLSDRFFALTPGWLTDTAGLVRRLGLHVILDLNVVADSPPMAARWAGAALRALPPSSVIGFEIGNEPDLYHMEAPYRLARRDPLGAMSGLLPGARAGELAEARTMFSEPSLTPSFSIANYLGDFRAYAAALAAVRPRVTLLGPAVANPQRDLSWLTSLIAADRRGLGELTGHRYPLSECQPPGSPQYPTIARLLSERSSAGMAAGIRAAVLDARRAGLAFRLTELNSVTCGGRPKVSNSFATALWAPDVLFALMRAGVNGVNMHIRDDAINAPFTLTRRGLSARPLLYGLTLFARSLGPEARLVALRVHASRRLHVKLWGVRVGPHVLNLVALNKGPRSAGLQLALAARGTATVQRLAAPSAHATSGVTLAGQWLNRQGRWLGRRVLQRIAPSRGAYELALPGDSAALVSLRLR